jgi:hypothetical protein
MSHQTKAHLRKMEHHTSVLHDDCRTISLETSPCSPEPPEETQKKTQRTVKSSEEYAQKQEKHQGKVGKKKGPSKMKEKHQWWDADRKDETHQRQHPVMSASYERPGPNGDNPYALRYSLKNTLNGLCDQLSALTRCKKHIAHTTKKTKVGVIGHLAT